MSLPESFYESPERERDRQVDQPVFLQEHFMNLAHRYAAAKAQPQFLWIIFVPGSRWSTC